MIDADRLIENIDKFDAICEKNKLESYKEAERFDLAIKEIESHRVDIQNAGKVLQHFGRGHALPVKVYQPDMDWQPQRVEFSYVELDGGRLRCGYTTGSNPNIGWLSDGSLKLGYNWSMKIDDVRAGILNGLNNKVVDGRDISFKQVVDALFKLATLYPEAEKAFINYFETLGK